MLFIANATKQHRVFNFRSPEVKRVQALHIPSGRQLALGSHWTAEQMQVVIDQLESLGAKRVDDVRNAKIGKFHGLVYSTSKAVTSDVIETAHEAVVETQHKRSVAEFEKAAAAVDIVMRDKAGKRRAKTVELTIKQDIPKGNKPSKDDIDSTIIIAEDGEDLRID